MNLPDFFDFYIFHSTGTATGKKLLPVVGQTAGLVFLRQDLSQSVGFHVIKTGHSHSGFGNILLVDHNAVGFVENICEQWMERFETFLGIPADKIVEVSKLDPGAILAGA